MRFILPSCGALFASILALPLSSHAQQTSAVKTMAPFVDRSTFVVVRVDVGQLDTAALMRQFGEIAPVREKELQFMSMAAVKAAEMFRTAGGEQLFIGMSMEDGWAEPFFAVPKGANTKVDAVIGLLRQVYRNGATLLHGDTIIVGNQRSIDRIKKLQPDMPKQIAAAFSSKTLLPVQGVVWIPPVLQQALSETAPGLPGLPDGDLAKPLWQGWNRISFGLATKPKIQIRVAVHAKNEETAEGIEQILGGMLLQLRQHPQIQKELKDFGKLIPLLRPQVDGDTLRWSVASESLVEILKPLFHRQSVASKVRQTHNKLRQFGLAMHNYHDTHKAFPAHANYDAKGKPLLSWRVHLLPYLEQHKLYKQFKLDEPWNSPHNKKLIAKMPDIFKSVVQPTEVQKQGMTRFLVPFGKNALFFGAKGTQIRSITDGTSNTIMVVEASPDQAVIWTKPSDLSTDVKDLRKALFGSKGKMFMAVFADGSSHVLDRKIELETLRNLITINDGKVINLP